MQYWWNGSDRGKQRYSGKKSRAILPTANHTCTCLVLIQGLRGEGPTTNRPNHGMARYSAGPGISESANLSCTCFIALLSILLYFLPCSSLIVLDSSYFSILADTITSQNTSVNQ